MTLAEFLAERRLRAERFPAGDREAELVQVLSREPGLWHLSDYVVSSTCSGPGVILRPREV